MKKKIDCIVHVQTLFKFVPIIRLIFLDMVHIVIKQKMLHPDEIRKIIRCQRDHTFLWNGVSPAQDMRKVSELYAF